MRIFVDVDDTLIILGKETDLDEFNQPLIDALIRAEPEQILVWSGGGRDYARLWANRLEQHTEGRIRIPWALVKDKTTFHNVRPDDVCIDDMASVIKGVAGRVIHPDQFIEEMDERSVHSSKRVEKCRQYLR
jgi:hypothetical protein